MPDSDKIQAELNSLTGVKGLDFEEYWISSVGKSLYEKFVKNYNKKMWKINTNKDFDTFKWSQKGVAIKEGPRAAWDTAISGYPGGPKRV